MVAVCLILLYIFGPPWPQSKQAPERPPPAPSRPARVSRPPKPEAPSQHTLPHSYRSDGLLEVNPNGTHPIFELIKKAEAAWNVKLRKASGTLHEATDEYVRRYKRAPPLGFDKWWEYVQENNVQLPDEYDFIHERLEPFWGVSPVDLRKILADWEDKSDVPVMVFGKADGKPIKILKNGMPEGDRAMFAEMLLDRIGLMLDIEEHLPDFRAVISPADTPNLLTDWELKQSALWAANEETCKPFKTALSNWAKIICSYRY